MWPRLARVAWQDASRAAQAPSLAIVRPRRVLDVVVRDADPWTFGQLSTLNQASLLATKSTLDKPAHAFAYRWECEEPGCNSHTQGIVDWELGQAYRAWERRGYDVINAAASGGWTTFAPVLPVGARSPPAARQLLPEALGWEEVQAAADPQRFQRWWAGLQDREPALFAHWQWARAY